jgi:hypothetical protein
MPVISTEAADSLTVRRAVKRPLYFISSLLLLFLLVIPEGDLLLFLPLLVPAVV